MKTVISAKLQLHTTPAEFAQLRATQLAYRDALNCVSQYAFEHGNQKCHYTLHADLVGARNITMRTLLIRQDWVSTGELSDRPDVSDREAKAARLQRYAELRWSRDTSSSP